MTTRVSVHEVITGTSSDTLPWVYELLERPAWHAQAACRGQGPEAWYPRKGAVLRPETLRLCAACPVAAECRDAGLTENHGVWGGLRAVDRGGLRRRAGVTLRRATRRTLDGDAVPHPQPRGGKVQI